MAASDDVSPDGIALDTEGYAVMLGGPQRRHLFICGSDSHDPVTIARAPRAPLRVVDVEVPGAGIPYKMRDALLFL
jgi:sugar lactone lactonase YvrE